MGTESWVQRGDLPRWAATAFIARCARRYVEIFGDDTAEPAAARSAATSAVKLAEVRASIGGRFDDDGGCVELDGQFFDNYDILSIYEALDSFTVAASNTLTDLMEDPGLEPQVRRNLTAIRLSSLALEAAFPDYLSDADSPNLQNVIDWTVSGEPTLKQFVIQDLECIKKLAGQECWDDESKVPLTIFGPLWPNGRPETWPDHRLTFRPRARIIRTIGDRLISGPEAAVIELVKNSYDADASRVRITFVPPFHAGQGQIIFEDDGHGMLLSDIQEKWMSPATSDKKQRKASPKGRKLLGSKGIGRFAASRLGSRLELLSRARDSMRLAPNLCERTEIKELDWNVFDQAVYLDDVSFPVKSTVIEGETGTRLKIWGLRDSWTEAALTRLYHELRRLVSPRGDGVDEFKIVLDLSRCTKDNCGFDGSFIVDSSQSSEQSRGGKSEPYEVRPFPVLEACDYVVEGIFDENGRFDGTVTVRRAGAEPEPITLTVPLKEGEESCGMALVELNIFDREAASIRSTAKVAGFGHLGVREARKLLDSIAGVAIYREGFRVRPYGDAENDWLTLDAKRVQNPSLKIGRNQVAGLVVVDDEETSQLIERSSREGLEENGSFRRLQSLILALLAEEVEPRRRKYRIAAGLEKKKQSGFHDVLGQAELPWAQSLLAKLPEGEREEAQKLISRESERLTGYLKDLEARQAQLEAQVTMGLIIGEVMHQGNTPLAFIENEVGRLQRWWPGIFADTEEAAEDRGEVPRILNGMEGSVLSLRVLFKALSPLAGARRGEPQNYSVMEVIEATHYLFKTRAENLDIQFEVDPGIRSLTAKGYPEDLTTALTNLIDNSIHWLENHNDRSRRIAIKVGEEEQGKIVLFFEDNGPGISDSSRDQLFDVGFTQKPNGTGLGLSIAREAMLRSAGELYVIGCDSGAKFGIALPQGH